MFPGRLKLPAGGSDLHFAAEWQAGPPLKPVASLGWLARCGNRIFRGQSNVWCFRTLHERWLHSYIFSPSGRDKSERADREKAEILFSAAGQGSDHRQWRAALGWPDRSDTGAPPGPFNGGRPPHGLG